MTTRFKQFAERLADDSMLIHVSPMNEKQAVDFKKYLKNYKSPQSEIADLAKLLDYLPLAIRQASAYITNGPPGMTLSDYVEIIKSTPSDELELLQEEYGDTSRDPDVPISYIRIWQMNFDQIKILSASAINILCLFGVLDREGVPVFLLATLSSSRVRLLSDLGLLHPMVMLR
jgi:hypothetical protein